MKRINRWLFLVFLILCLPLTACSPVASGAEEDVRSIEITRMDGDEPTQEVLTEEAAGRLDIQTSPAQMMAVDGAQRTVVPYGAILYDNQGDTWLYLNPAPLTYVRHKVDVSRIEQGQAILVDSLSGGAQVVTIGAAELYGAEFEFEEE